MKRTSLIIIIGLLFSFPLAWSQEVYQWVDEKGTTHFTDNLSLVPEKYRNQVQKEAPPKGPAPTQPASPQSIKTPKSAEDEKEAKPTPGSAAEQKDIIGRGEEWWRAKAREWNEKLVSAQKNYENAYNEWKSKEQELESSKFKPDSVKRKLKTEIKALEEKAKDLEKQVEEAKDMVEKVLPKQAQDYRASPEWLKIEEKK
jgi:hypothetical protein